MRLSYSSTLASIFHHIFVAIRALFLSSLFLCACDRDSHGRIPLERKLPEARVQIARAEVRTRDQLEEVVGTLRPRVRSVVSPKVSGRIEEIFVSSGQEVKEGQVLMRIEAEEARAKLVQAEAVLRQAEQDLGRFDKLLKQQAITQQDYDAAVSKASVARASVMGAQSLLSYAKITAPFSGVVTQKYVDVGDLASPGGHLLEIVSPGALRFETEVPEGVMSFVQLGLKVQVKVAVYAKPIDGTISEIVPVADPASRTFLVKTDLPSIPGLLPGQFGRVSIPVGKVESIQLPRSAVIWRGQLEIVFVIKDSRAWIRLVKTGRQIGDSIEILSGLSQDEQVVSSGIELLQDGQSVIVEGAR